MCSGSFGPVESVLEELGMTGDLERESNSKQNLRPSYVKMPFQILTLAQLVGKQGNMETGDKIYLKWFQGTAL